MLMTDRPGWTSSTLAPMCLEKVTSSLKYCARWSSCSLLGAPAFSLTERSLLIRDPTAPSRPQEYPRSWCEHGSSYPSSDSYAGHSTQVDRPNSARSAADGEHVPCSRRNLRTGTKIYS